MTLLRMKKTFKLVAMFAGLGTLVPEARESWMFERFLAAGIAVAGVDVGESYGSPQGRTGFSALYRELVEQRRFSRKPVLLARSRGGLVLYNWAAEHPESVSGIAGIYPVCNLRSWPSLDRACGAYGLTARATGRPSASGKRMAVSFGMCGFWSARSKASRRAWRRSMVSQMARRKSCRR